MLSIPLWGMLALIVLKDYPLAILFLFSALMGTIAEFLLGFFHHSIDGHRVWQYNAGNIGLYTSYYSIPFWGGAGLMFYGLSRLIIP